MSDLGVTGAGILATSLGTAPRQSAVRIARRLTTPGNALTVLPLHLTLLLTLIQCRTIRQGPTPPSGNVPVVISLGLMCGILAARDVGLPL